MMARVTRVIVIICGARDQDQASTPCQLVVTSAHPPHVLLSSCGCLHVLPFCPHG